LRDSADEVVEVIDHALVEAIKLRTPLLAEAIVRADWAE
jgi:hypothetical protein